MDKISPKFAKEENQKKKKNTSVAGKLARNVEKPRRRRGEVGGGRYT